MGILDVVELVAWPMNTAERVFGSVRHGDVGQEIRLTRYRPESGASDISGVEAARILKRYGIPSWGGHANSDWFVMYVPRAQARWAQEILTRAYEGQELPTARAERSKATTAQRAKRELWG